jgi:hypothetical protein
MKRSITLTTSLTNDRVEKKSADNEFYIIWKRGLTAKKPRIQLSRICYPYCFLVPDQQDHSRRASNAGSNVPGFLGIGERSVL